MKCPRCSSDASWDDNFCRRCGWAFKGSRLPVRRTVLPPAVWRRAAPAVAQTAAMVALGVAAEILLRSGTRWALRLPSALGPGGGKSKALARRKGELLSAGGVAVSETLIMRRVTLRR